MLGHAMYLASGKASKKEIDDFFIQMGWKSKPKKKKRRGKRR